MSLPEDTLKCDDCGRDLPPSPLPDDFGTKLPAAGPTTFRLPNEKDLAGYTEAEWREINL